MQSKTFRLFISSPFSDFTKEREVLHKKVFPKIDKYCTENGFSFQPIDLRWGVSNEAQLDQKTLEVCLEEVKACKHFPHPNFLIMAGDRYGYVPCPYMIESKEFEDIKKYILYNNEDIIIKYKPQIDLETKKVISQKSPIKTTKLALLERWYKEDKNQIYDLKEKDSTAYIIQVRKDDYEIYVNWDAEEIEIRKILQESAKYIFKDRENKEYQKYFLSATKAEALEGIYAFGDKTEFQKTFNDEIDKKYIFGYTRTIENLIIEDIDQDKPLSKEKKMYLDTCNNNLKDESEYLDKQLYKQAQKFKKELKVTLDENILKEEYSTFKSVKEYEESKLEDFGDYLVVQLKRAIDFQAQNVKLLEDNIVKTYLDEQKYNLQQKHKIFMGKQEELNLLSKLLIKQKNQKFKLLPYFIYSKKGYGKTALLYNFSQQSKKCIFRNTESVIAFNQFNQLLITIDFNNLDESNILIIDGIEHFNDSDIQQLINKCKTNKIELILATNSLAQFSRLTAGKPYPIIKLENIANDNLFNVDIYIEKYMKIENRKLTQVQKAKIEKYLSKVYDLNKFNLYLDLLKNDTHESRILKFDIDILVNEYKNEKLKYIETTVIEYFISYLKSIQIGLSESEILYLLNKNTYVIESIKNDFHELQEHKLPISIWSKLLKVMKPFIQEINYDGKLLYSLKNDFLVNKYKSHKVECSNEIYQYLISKKDSNPRIILETMYALIHSSQYNILFEKLSNKGFQEEYISHLGISSLIKLIIRAFQKIIFDSNISKFEDKFTQLIEELINSGQLDKNMIFLETTKEDAVDFLVFLMNDSTLIDLLKTNMLVIAIESDSKNIFDYLLDKVTDINCPDIMQRFPITVATKVNNTYMVKKLIDTGSKLEINNIENWPPILFVAENLNFELLKIFIDKKIDINIKADGLTPLLLAAQQKKKDEVYKFAKLLIENGANVSEEEYSEIRSFEEKYDGLSFVGALTNNSLDLKSFDEEDGFEYSKSTALHYAIIYSNYDLAELLLENEANPNHCNNFGSTPLLLLCKNSDNVDLVKLLLKYGADLDIKDEDGYDSRFYVIYSSNSKSMDYLFEIGEIPYQLNINERDYYLEAALGSDNVEYFKKLNEYGIDLSQTNIVNRNLLFIAGDFNAKKCLEYFINVIGLDLNGKDSTGNTPLNFLISSSNLTKERVDKCIQEQKNSENKVYCTYDIAKTYLELGANPNIHSQDGTTPLYWAVAKDLYEISELLIKYDADPNLAVSSGTTPFVYAAAKCDLKYLELMMPKVKDINYKAKNGVTALMIAARSFDKVQFLLENGADSSIVSDSGQIALDLAVDPAIIVLLENVDKSELQLTDENTRDLIKNLNSSEIENLYSENENNRMILKKYFIGMFDEIVNIYKRGEFEKAKNDASHFTDSIPLQLIKDSHEMEKKFHYMEQFRDYDFTVSRMLHFQNKIGSKDSNINDSIEYFSLVKSSYSENDDIFWSSYIYCCMNLTFFFDKEKFVESYCFAQEALDIIDYVKENKIYTKEDSAVFNQIMGYIKNILQVIENSGKYSKSLMDFELVQDNKLFLDFIQSQNKFTEGFRALLLIAKGLSIKYNNAEEIRITELFNALHSVVFSSQAKEVFSQIFGNNMDNLNEDTDGDELIALAKSHPKVNFDEDLKSLVKKLKEVFKDEKILNIRRDK